MRPLLMLALASLAACNNDPLYYDASEDADGDGFAVVDDCNDADASVFPGAEEVCDGIDNDCNGVVDGDDATDAVQWYVDLDGDGAAGTPTPLRACSAPAGAVAEPTDCDDVNQRVFPGADEVCNDRDDDCDGLVDDEDDDVFADTARSFYADLDGDGYGDPASEPIAACSTPEGYSDLATDCDDGAAGVFPGATEVCNEVDDDCNGLADDSDPRLDLSSADTWYLDRDGDGAGGAFFPVRACEQPEQTTADATDCDDLDARILPGATEICDGRDNNCDGAIDDADAGLDASTGTAWFADTDGDGAGAGDAVFACAAASGRVGNDDDCDDANAARFPGADEICNGIDDDCDTRVDDDDPSLDATTAGRWWSDRDGDGHGGTWFSLVACEQPDGMSADGDDCDDDNAEISPSAPEVCNGRDDNCNDLVDDADSGLDTSTGSPWYADADLDGWGTSGDPVMACEAPEGFGTDQSDCDDDNAAIHPGAAEVCNGIDDDCNNAIDDDDDNLTAEGASYWRDRDGDGWGTEEAFACEDFGFGWASAVGDCNDSDAEAFPEAPERCNYRDDDCDGAVDEDPTDALLYYVDADFDGYGGGDSIAACRQEYGTSARDGDCDDTRSSVRPGAEEVCDGIDNNCNDIVDTDTLNLPAWYVDADEDGYGLDGTGVLACATFDGRVDEAGDCDDDDASVNPGEAEVDEDGKDNDCDGNVDLPDPLVGGLIDEDVTWGDEDGGLFELDFNALVTEGTTLTIEPCTRILMAADATLQIEGTLIARGTEACPIVFTSGESEPAPGDWARVYFTSTHTSATVDGNGEYVSGSILEHVEVLYAGGVGAGVVIEGSDAPFLRYLRVAYSSSIGLDARGGRVTVQDSVFEHNASMGMQSFATNYNTPILLRSIFRDNGSYGARLGSGCCGATPSTVHDNVFANNGSAGLWMEGRQSGRWDLQGNRFLYNNGLGLQARVAPGDFDGNWFIGNRGGASVGYSGLHTYTNNVFADNTGIALQTTGYGTDHELLGNTFVRNERIHTGNTPNNGGLYGYFNLFQSSTSNEPWISFTTQQESEPSSFLNSNNFVGEPVSSYLTVGYPAGSGRVDVEGNYWGGNDPNADAWVLLDFIDQASLAVADPSPYFLDPVPDAPMSVPEGVQVVAQEGGFALSWQAVADVDVADYRVYYGLQTHPWELDGTGAAEGDSGFAVSGTEVVLTELDPSLPWRFAVTSRDGDADGNDDMYNGNESWFSVVVQP